MPKIILNTPAPDFSLEDFQGKPFQLQNFQGHSHTLLIFNRGFA